MLFSGNKPEDISLRSVLDLTPNHPFSASENLTISFDLSFFSSGEYGTVFKLTFKEHNFNVKLQYVPYQDDDTSNLILVINGKDPHIIDRIAKSELYRYNWLTQTFKVDLLNDKIIYSGVSNKNYNVEVDMPDDVQYTLTFGRAFRDNFVPAMAIRNIKILNNSNEVEHFFPLDETHLTTIYDNNSIHFGSVITPEWLSTANTRLKKIFSFSLPFPLEGIPFNRKESKLNILYENFLLKVSLLNFKVDTVFYENKYFNFGNTALFNKYDGSIISYYGGLGEVTEYRNNNWSQIDISKNQKNYFGHSRFINPLDSSLISLGGYGNYKVSNEIRRYNKKTKIWENQKLNGDFLPPFRYAATTLSNDGSKLYVFGGEGNEKGHQELGFNYYYSLYEIELSSFTVKKIKSFKEPEEFSKITYRTCRNMILKDNHLYGYFTYSEKSNEVFNKAVVFSIDLDKKDISLAGTYNISSENNIPVNLFYLDKTNELIFIIRSKAVDDFDYNIYALSYPPTDLALIVHKTKGPYSSNYYTFTIFISIIGLIFIISFFYIKKQKRVKNEKPILDEEVKISPEKLKEQDEDTFDTKENSFSPVEKENPSSINLFGTINICDRDNVNITPEFKPKVLQLLLLITLSTKNGGKDVTGITSEKLSTILWPEFDEQHAKNNRNANMARLRSLLEDVDGIEIIFDKKQWMLKVDDIKQCDYLNYKHLLSRLKNGFSNCDDTFEEFLSIIKKGIFLKDVSYEWLDSVKMNIISDVISICLNKAELKFNDGDYNFAVKVADVILEWDNINESALKLKLNSLNSLGRLGEAKKSYEYFIGDYTRSFDKPYKKSFDELVM